MQLRTPKRYTTKGSKRPLLNLKWLWLYLLAPLILIPAVLAWDYRAQLADAIGQHVNQMGILKPPAPTPTPIPPDAGSDLGATFTSGKITKAINILKVVGETAPNVVGTYSLVTQLLVLRSYSENQAMLDDAIQMGQKAINANPESPEGWIVTAMALDWDRRPQEALGYILRSRDFDNKDPMGLAVMAEIYHDLGKDDEALKYVDGAIANAKTGATGNRAALAHAHYVKGLILEATAIGADAAVTEYEDAWRTATGDPPDPTIPAGYIAQYLGVYYKNLGQNQKAISILTDAIKRDSDDPFLPYQLGQVYLNQGDPNKARAYAETCRDLDPNQIRCLRLLAKLSFREQNYSAALDTIQKVIAQGSKEPNDYLVAGLAYSYSNQCTTAIPLLQQGMTYIAANDETTRANFNDALRECGAPVNALVETPPADSGDTGEAAVATDVATKSAAGK